MAVWIKRPDQSGECCECKTTPCEPCGATAPCSIFEDDDTLYGQKTLGLTAGSVQWDDLGVGSFTFVFVDHVYKILESVPCGDAWGMSGLTYVADEFSGSFPNQLSHTFPNTCGGDNSGYPSDAAASAAYHLAALPAFFVGNNMTFAVDAILSFAGSPYGSSPQPVFDLMRTDKLRVPTPSKLTVELDPFDAGRWRATWEGNETTELEFAATAVEVEDALNALASITGAGGVTVTTASITGGVEWEVTWNNNGARSLLSTRITTANPGIFVTVEEVTPGDGSTQAVQKITRVRSCLICNEDEGSDEWTGEIETVQFGYPIWRFTLADSGDYLDTPTTTNDLQINGSQFADAWCYLEALFSGSVDPGTHKWAVTFVAGGIESEIGPSATWTYGPGGVKVPLTIPIGPGGTTARRIYRTVAGGSTFFFVAEIADNTTTTYDDDTADDDLGDEPPEESEVDPPDEAPILAKCQWRLLLFCFITFLGSLNARVFWSGRKLSGDTPDGDYVWIDNAGAAGGTACELDQTDGVPTLTVTGSDLLT